VSKCFLACAVGFLQQEGRVDIEDKVMDYFPSYLPENLDPAFSALKIKHLLMMGTGQEGAPVHDSANALSPSGDLRHQFFQRKVVFPPGTRFQYDSYASYMLSALIQTVTKENLVDYLTPPAFCSVKHPPAVLYPG
jgi:CubicO group peptidase (beta-lactamase class C family)